MVSLYSVFCDHSVLYLYGTFILLKKSGLCKLRRCYYEHCKYPLYLPLSYRNWRIIRKYQAPDITPNLQELHDKLSTQAYRRLTLYHGLIRLFCWPFSLLILLYLLCCAFVPLFSSVRSVDFVVLMCCFLYLCCFLLWCLFCSLSFYSSIVTFSFVQ